MIDPVTLAVLKGRRATATLPMATSISSTTPMPAEPTCHISGWCGRSTATAAAG